MVISSSLFSLVDCDVFLFTYCAYSLFINLLIYISIGDLQLSEEKLCEGGVSSHKENSIGWMIVQPCFYDIYLW